MVSAGTTIRYSCGGPGLLDGCAAGVFSRNQEPAGGLGEVPGRVGPVLPDTAQPNSFQDGPTQGESPQEDGEVIRDLWFRLSPEDRVRFGNCFSRMVLRMLGRQPRRRWGGAS
jgi:hypothetical protein